MRIRCAAISIAVLTLCIALPSRTFAQQHITLVNGTMPSTQRVGGFYTASLTFRNNGTAITHPVLDLSAVTAHWIIVKISSNLGRGKHSSVGSYVRYGTWQHGKAARFVVKFSARDAGRFPFSISVWSGWQSGQAPTKSLLDKVNANVTVK